MSSKLLSILALVALILGAGVLLGKLAAPTIEAIPRQPLALKIQVPAPDLLGGQIDSLISGATLEPATAAAVVQAASQPAPANGSLVTGSTVTAVSDPANKQDIDKLFRLASRFAYIQYGEVSGKRIATFLDTQSNERKVATEGTNLNGLEIRQVAPEFVMLGYGKADPLQKPRVDLEVKNPEDRSLSPEEKEARMIRYRELWGNRYLAAAKESGVAEVRLPTADEEKAAMERYKETYGELMRRLQSGKTDANPADFPDPSLNFDEAVRHYFDTHWPGQVEVSTEPAPPAGEGDKTSP
jgi:hypothetical protein